MRGEPILIVTCDDPNCGDEFEASLTPLADGSYDERGVNKQLENAGWTKDGDRDLCSDCSEDDD